MSSQPPSIAQQSPMKPDSTSKPKPAWLLEKERLCDHQVIIRDLAQFTCKCRPKYCLQSEDDVTFVGLVRNVVRKLGTRKEVLISVFYQVKMRCCL